MDLLAHVGTTKALGALGAFARNGPRVGENSDLDAIETYVRDQWPRALLSVSWSGEFLTSLWASAMTRPTIVGQSRILRIARLHPLDLFEKYGFDEGDVLDEHFQALRAEGWYIGADELLWAGVQEKLLPRLDPRPVLVGFGSSHNNVRADLKDYEADIDEEDFDVVRALTSSWPAMIKVGATDILAIGLRRRTAYGPSSGIGSATGAPYSCVKRGLLAITFGQRRLPI